MQGIRLTHPLAIQMSIVTVCCRIMYSNTMFSLDSVALSTGAVRKLCGSLYIIISLIGEAGFFGVPTGGARNV